MNRTNLASIIALNTAPKAISPVDQIVEQKRREMIIEAAEQRQLTQPRAALERALQGKTEAPAGETRKQRKDRLISRAVIRLVRMGHSRKAAIRIAKASYAAAVQAGGQ